MSKFDPVESSNSITHPIDLGKKYKDKFSGFEGYATAIVYGIGEGSLVSLTRGDEKNLPENVSIPPERLISVDNSRIDLSVVPVFPVNFGDKYKAEITNFEGYASAIIYSMNKCVQVELARADEKGKPEYVNFDIQSLIPMEGAKEHNLTSDKVPGAPMHIPTSRHR